MGKWRTFSQRVGKRGEDAFRPFSSRNGLSATKFEEDLGVDFVCQVEAKREGRKREISGKLVGVCVRSTSQKTRRIRIDVSDAEAMLAADYPVCLALVEVLPTHERVHYRFLDEQFAIELAEFLRSGQATTTFRPTDGFREDGFEEALTKALTGSSSERVRLAVAQHQLSDCLPGARLRIQRTSEGEFTIVEAGDYFGYFVRSGEPQRDEVYNAIFGSPRLRDDRLAALGPRPEVRSVLEGLPTTAVLAGGVSEYDFELVAENSTGQDTETFTRIASATHTGWVHDGGFAITISIAKRDGANYIHEMDVVVDPDESLYLTAEPSLWRFLERCTHDSKIGPAEARDHRTEATYFAGLAEANFFATCLRSAISLDGWALIDAPLRLVRDSENLHTLAWCAEISDNPAMLHGFGFQLISRGSALSEFIETPVRCDVPVVANFGASSVVTWVDADVTFFEIAGQARGLRFDEVFGASVEPHERLTKATSFPELVVDETWPTIVTRPHSQAQTESQPDGWGLGIRSIRDRL